MSDFLWLYCEFSLNCLKHANLADLWSQIGQHLELYSVKPSWATQSSQKQSYGIKKDSKIVWLSNAKMPSDTIRRSKFKNCPQFLHKIASTFL